MELERRSLFPKRSFINGQKNQVTNEKPYTLDFTALLMLSLTALLVLLLLFVFLR